jgi:hypothetical protein
VACQEAIQLDGRHVFQRLQLVLEYTDSIQEKWKGDIQSDECAVEISDSGIQMWVFGQLPDKMFPDCIAPQ